jgi:eukaryotic-like serine/threonine-protein kinase
MREIIGKDILHYRIAEEIGRGGMGVVYKAHDTKLNRTVALKFLPPHISASEQDKARFIQEAQSASALNHPNVCTIHDIQEYDGQLFIVMEFVDGQTLRDLTEKGPPSLSPLGKGGLQGGLLTNHETPKVGIQLKQAVEIGIQIAEGLAAAHEKGIVHRDIKPDNIMIRKDGIAQIMDFGLAKLKGSVSQLTKEGSTVGTAAYMSPEAVQGQDTDHRSDIFSLGVLLHELFTGDLPFKGVHETALAYEIVNVDAPPMSSVKPEIDQTLDAIVLECLEKDPRERAQSASQVAVDLKRYRRESSRQRVSRITAARPALSSSSVHHSMDVMQTEQPEVSKKAAFPWMVMAAIAVVMLLSGYGISQLNRATVDTLPVIRAPINMPQGIRYFDDVGGHSAISPDGMMIVFTGMDSLSQSRLWIRPMNSAEARSLAGTEDAQYPFWSPDSRSIGFFAEGKVKTIDAAGGPVFTVADAPFGRGGAWSKNGEILFSPAVNDADLYAVSSSGGTPRSVISIESDGIVAPRFPSFLPDGNHFVFTKLNLDGVWNQSTVYVGSLSSGVTKPVIDGASHGIASSGYLFYLRQGILLAQPFDSKSFTLSGRPVSVQGNLNSWSARAKADYSVSDNGILLYAVSGASRISELFWIEPDGSTASIDRIESMMTISLSPDETKIVYDMIDARGERPDVWLYDLTSRVRSRFTLGSSGGYLPCWSKDGTEIFYRSEVGGHQGKIFVKKTDGSGDEELLVSDESSATSAYQPDDVSPDGRFLLITIQDVSGTELAVVDLHNPERPVPEERLGISGSNGRFSPDGKWIVYQSSESGVSKIYVSSFRGVAGKWQLPTEAGARPYWAGDSIVYRSSARDRYEISDISFATGRPAFSQPRAVFRSGVTENFFIRGVSNDGKRFLAESPDNIGSGSNLFIIANWRGLVEAE